MGKGGTPTELLRDKMKESLDFYYYELYDYFLDVASSNYDYKVLITRRCLVLYQAFLKLFSADAARTDNRDPRLSSVIEWDDRIMSDLSTIRFYQFCNSATVLIVDDVIIHGNHMCGVYQQLTELFPSLMVTAKVYMISDQPKSNSIPQDFWRRLLWTDESKHGEWMELSNRIVNTIYYSNIPYVSHLGTYRLPKSIDFSKYCTSLREIEYENKAQQRVGCKSRVLFCEKPRLPFFETVSILDCLRVYSNSCDSCQTVIPYSFTKAVRKDSHELFFTAIANYVPENMPHTRDQFRAQKNSLAWDLYRVRLFKALVSQMFMVFFFHDKDITSEVCPFALWKSFDAETAREFGDMSYASIEAILKNPCEDLAAFFCEDFQERPELVSILRNVRRGSADKDVFLDYIWQHRLFEENRLSHQDKSYCGKLPGISVNYILKSAKDLEEMRNNAVQILNLNDSGCATSTYAVSEDQKAYSTFLSNGEQSFRVIMERYPMVIRKMIFLEERGEQVESYLEELFAWWEKTLVDDVAKRKAELTDFYQQYRGQLSDKNVISILEVPEFWDSQERKNLLDFHKSYFSV